MERSALLGMLHATAYFRYRSCLVAGAITLLQDSAGSKQLLQSQRRAVYALVQSTPTDQVWSCHSEIVNLEWWWIPPSTE